MLVPGMRAHCGGVGIKLTSIPALQAKRFQHPTTLVVKSLGLQEMYFDQRRQSVCTATEVLRNRIASQTCP